MRLHEALSAHCEWQVKSFEGRRSEQKASRDFAIPDLQAFDAVVHLGGLAWDQERLGAMLGVAAIFFTLWMMLGVPRVVSTCGVRKSVRVFAFALALVLCVAPSARNFVGALVGWLSITLCTSVLETVLVAATNNSAPERVRGAVTGVVTTVEAVAKCVGPPSAATLYAFSIDEDAHRKAPIALRHLFDAIGHRLSFFALATASLLICLLSFGLPRRVENDPTLRCPEQLKGADGDLV